MEIVKRFFQPSKTSYFLFGPRGTGKSTWLRQQYKHAIWLDLLDPGEHRLYLARPERLRELVAGRPHVKYVIIDEVQKAPVLLDVVHELIESNSSLRFVLTGSSARKLRRGAANLLAGRLVEASFHPFMAAELGDAFDLNRALQLGMVPLVMGSKDPNATVRAYASLYLREEVQAEALVRDVGAFARFLEAISFSHGSVLNLAEVARECHVGRKTVEGYLDILVDLLLAFRIPVFTRRAKRHLIRHEKFFYFDAGVYRSLRPCGPLDRPEEIEGMALEGLVAQHLRAWLAYRQSSAELYYWRTKAGTEVDFVVYGPDIFYAIEVKRAGNIHRKDVRALRAFLADYPEARAVVIYLGKNRLVVDGVPCIPCDEFLLGLSPSEKIDNLYNFALPPGESRR